MRAGAARFRRYDEIDLAIEPVETSYETIQRKFAGAAGNYGGDVRLLQPDQGGGLRLRQSSSFQNGSDRQYQLGLQQFFFWILKTEIGEHIIRPVGHIVLDHVLPLFKNCVRQ